MKRDQTRLYFKGTGLENDKISEKERIFVSFSSYLLIVQRKQTLGRKMTFWDHTAN